jgi:hypothetical protein
MNRRASLRQAQSFVRNLTVGAIRETWLPTEMIERIAAGHSATREHLVQLALKSDDYLPFNDPYYWRAFTCQGDPGPLESPASSRVCAHCEADLTEAPSPEEEAAVMELFEHMPPDVLEELGEEMKESASALEFCQSHHGRPMPNL